jgi:hypothetical protein
VDLLRLRSGELLAGFSAIGLLAVMFADWFGGASAWDTMTIARVVLVLLVVCALTLVAFTLTRTVAMATSIATITIAVGAIALLLVFYRVVINEPGPNALVSVDLGAWRTLVDERTGAAASLRQTERVLAVRGASRAAPPPRDPSRPAPRA